MTQSKKIIMLSNIPDRIIFRMAKHVSVYITSNNHW